MSNNFRITGLASGLDVDSLVKSMLKADNVKIDKLKQQRQLLVWKQEMYRSYLTDMTSFKNTYFNVAKQDSYMLSENAYSGFDVSNAVSSTSSIVTASAGAGATAGTYNIKDIITATKAAFSSPTTATVKEADSVVRFKVKADDITASNYDKLTIRVNDTDYAINLSGDHASLGALVNDINTKLTTADKAGTPTDISKLVTASLSEDGTSIKFAAATGNTLNSISDSTNAAITDNKLNFKINVEAGVNDRLLVKINGTSTSVTLAAGAYSSLSALNTEINSKLTSAGLNTSLQAGLSADGNKIKFTSTNPTNLVSVSGTSISMLGFLGSSFDVQSNVSSKMSTLFSSDAEAKVAFTINGKNFSYDFSRTGADRDKTIYNVLGDISSTAGVKLSYSEIGRKFTIESLETGQAQSITASEAADGTGGAFLQTLFGVRNISATGRDATATVTNPAGDSLTVTRSDNTISIDGINISLLKDDSSVEGINLKVTANTQKTYDKIVAFVDKYNELVGSIQSKLIEKKQYSYLPLTDEQREAMNEDDIKAWETKAKEGIMRSDSSLQNMLYSMRRAFFDEVEGSGVTLSQIGISTSANYQEGGKIIIDETKLKNAIQNNGTQVSNIFAKTSEISYDPNHKADTGRYQEIGIFQRINDIFKDYSRTNRDSNMKKGILIEKAGIKGDITEFQSILSKQIEEDYDDKINEMLDKLGEKENKYYLQFSELEVAMQKLNNQSSWLTSQLSSL